MNYGRSVAEFLPTVKNNYKLVSLRLVRNYVLVRRLSRKYYPASHENVHRLHMKALIRKSDEPRPATSMELERLRALRRIVIFQDDLDVIDRSIMRLEADASAGFQRRGASLGLPGQAGTLPA